MASLRPLVAILAILPVFATAGTLGLHNAYAINGLQCTDVTQGVDATTTDVNSSDTITCLGGSTNPASAFVRIQKIDPTGTVVDDSGPVYEIDNPTCGTTFVPSALSSTPNGVWHVVCTFYSFDNNQLGRETADFDVSFFVLPESPVGVAALMGSSLAALGAFVVHKKRKTVA